MSPDLQTKTILNGLVQFVNGGKIHADTTSSGRRKVKLAGR
jgi:hypothetical protein